MRYQGKITSWKDDQGFGFISPNGGGKQVFVHIKSFANRRRRPTENEIVTFELKTDDKGRESAVDVAFVGDTSRVPKPSGQSKTPLGIATVFLVLIASLVISGKLPLVVLGLYVVASIVSFIAYARDKSAARNSQWRTPEISLHLYSLIGGWPGALAAQSLLRHKSKKQSFQIKFWTTVVLNCGALGWAFTHSGMETLHSFLGVS